MEKYVAVVKYESNKITKYQDFAEESDANAHISTYGGFVAEKPDNDRIKYWIVDADKKTLTYDSDTATSDKITRAWSSLRRQRDNKIAKSDWMSNPDSPTMSDAWKTYRQELRDLPSKYNDTTVQETITWPTEPS